MTIEEANAMSPYEREVLFLLLRIASALEGLEREAKGIKDD